MMLSDETMPRAMAMKAEAAGVSEVHGLLPAAVLAYIDRNQLYRPLTDAS